MIPADPSRKDYLTFSISCSASASVTWCRRITSNTGNWGFGSFTDFTGGETVRPTACGAMMTMQVHQDRPIWVWHICIIRLPPRLSLLLPHLVLHAANSKLSPTISHVWQMAARQVLIQLGTPCAIVRGAMLSSGALIPCYCTCLC